jgi:hypothetical protein
MINRLKMLFLNEQALMPGGLWNSITRSCIQADPLLKIFYKFDLISQSPCCLIGLQGLLL